MRKYLMVAIWRHVPDNVDYIKRVAYLNKTPNFKPLIDCGFLECASDCKQMLATARPETETETEKKHSVVGMPEGFISFWNAWPQSPRKVAKAECLKRWNARGLETSAAEIVAHVNAAKQSKQWQSGYEPAPLTYLNQKRWEDGAPSEREEVQRFVI